ncbi:hypothetical protein F6V30_14325 [Oryzomonas sagensis]|uniref:Uncharacterized protein n=1 Tax=Oryzomonas sagensis TaxID=2603857 RepID=A0ABQ6TL72_9BACT|nr:hypothetical protein [Oryzomonas sagensis]KAB0669009.1 hypothetical protein F6V30_14325 [Oryzomonas sagensis]
MKKDNIEKVGISELIGATYNEKDLQMILNNVGSVLTIPLDKTDTAKFFSDLLGYANSQELIHDTMGEFVEQFYQQEGANNNG